MSPNSTKRLLQVVILLVVVGLSLYLRWQRGEEQPGEGERPVAQQADGASQAAEEPEESATEPAAMPPADRPVPGKSPAEPATAVKTTAGPQASSVSKASRAAKPSAGQPSAGKPSAGQPAAPAADRPRLLTSVPNQTIRDREGEVVFRGTVDLSSTLRRIESGRRLAHPNDGTVFQNRERRLPNQPTGHYREWVHPTPNLSGPGPQRIVTGEDGEFFYTPDHYRTFRKLNL